MSRKIQPVSGATLARVEEARVARLATLDAESRPHIVPICFAYHEKLFYSAALRAAIAIAMLVRSTTLVRIVTRSTVSVVTVMKKKTTMETVTVEEMIAEQTTYSAPMTRQFCAAALAITIPICLPD